MVDVENLTAIDTAWLKRLVGAVTPPPGLDNCKVLFLPSAKPAGMADPVTRTARVWVPRALDLVAGIPRHRQNRRVPDRPVILLKGLSEIVVFITAHELRHMWQHHFGKLISPRCETRLSSDERDANAYAARVLRRFRRREFGGMPGVWPGVPARDHKGKEPTAQ